MKKVLLIIFIISILVFGASAFAKGFLKGGNLFQRSVCDKPLTYKIGTIDSRFNLTEAKVEADLISAELVWEKPTGKNLFQYDPTAKLAVDFVYDKKQGLNTQINSLEGQLNSGRGDLESRKAAYDKSVAEFNKKAADLNSDIQKWNTQGGAPPDEFAKLKQRQNDLEAEAQKLSEEAKSLNLSAKQYNLDVGKLNNTIVEFNADLAKKPEEGLYDGQANTISIYFVPSQTELEHTLGHEMGHALGLIHEESNKKSIMYPYSSETTIASADDIAMLNTLCAPKSLPEAIFTNASSILQNSLSGQIN